MAIVQLTIVLMMLAGPLATAAIAQSDVRLRDYIHTTWTHHDGVPLEQVEKILQTPDGYLWIFTTGGLLRFDGMRFVRPSMPCTQPIRTQAPASDGGFWAVCDQKLIRRTADARFVVVSDGLSPGQHKLLEDRQGRVWILGQTIRYLNADGTPGRVFESPRAEQFFVAAQDSAGTIWARDRRNLYHVYEDRIEFVTALDAFGCLIPSRAGGVYAMASTGLWHLRKGARPSLITIAGFEEANGTLEACIAEAEDGGLWVGMRRGAVAAVRGGRLESLAGTDRIERSVSAVFIDREGTLWAGATSGLHRFRRPIAQLTGGSAAIGQPWFVFVDSSTNLWIGTQRGTFRLDQQNGSERPVIPRDSYSAIGEDEKGTIWLSNEKMIGYVANGRFITVPDVTGAPVAEVHAFTRDEQGHLWALAHGIGVYRVTPGPPRLVAASPGARYRFLVSQRTGIWLALRSGGVEQHVNGRVNTFPNPDPADRSVSPMAIIEDGDSIWVGSFRGLERLRNGRWTIWTRDQGLPGNGRVKALIADRSGHFWMMTDGGLLRVPRAQLDAAPDGSPTPLSFARIGSLDGVVPHPGNLRSSPLVASDGNGRLYFTTVDAIAVVDPEAVSEASLMPPIVLESVVVDNEPVDHQVETRFVEPSRLQFDTRRSTCAHRNWPAFVIASKATTQTGSKRAPRVRSHMAPCLQARTGFGSLAQALKVCGTTPARRSRFRSSRCSGARGGSSCRWWRWGCRSPAHSINCGFARSRDSSMLDWRHVSASGRASRVNCTIRCCSRFKAS